MSEKLHLDIIYQTSKINERKKSCKKSKGKKHLTYRGARVRITLDFLSIVHARGD